MHNRSGIAAIEFALVAPLFLTMAVGVFDASRAMIIYQQVVDTAHNVANAASVAATINADNSTTMTDIEANSSMSIIWAQMPWLEAGILDGKRSVVLTSVAFRPIAGCNANNPTIGSPNCYKANVAFSVPYSGDKTGNLWDLTPRACVTLFQYTGTPPNMPNSATLATGAVSGPDALLVADVYYKFSPSAPFTLLVGPFTFSATASVTPRTGSTSASPSGAGQYMNYSGTQGTGNCPNV